MRVTRRENPVTEMDNPASSALFPAASIANGTRYKKLENAIVFIDRMVLMRIARTDRKSQRLPCAVFSILPIE